MLAANLISTLFYSLSYPYIYAESLKIVPRGFIGMEQIVSCVGTILFCRVWVKYSDKLFKHYASILYAELFMDCLLFGVALATHNMDFYFVLNVLIYAIITRNVICGGTKMRAKINPTETARERYDNNVQIVDAVATLCGAGLAIAFPVGLNWLFIFALIGNVVDNMFYLYIYNKLKENGHV